MLYALYRLNRRMCLMHASRLIMRTKYIRIDNYTLAMMNTFRVFSDDMSEKRTLHTNIYSPSIFNVVAYVNVVLKIIKKTMYSRCRSISHTYFLPAK